VLVVWVTIYQAIENYFLSPRLTAKTMEINGGVAFGAALAGGALGGPMGAIVALPMAAMVTAFIKEYAHNYPVVYQSAYADPVPASTDTEAPTQTAGIADQSPA
jgi:predicted PurR-regulated permease PerM